MARRGSVPRSLAGLLAIVLVVETFVARSDPAFTSHAVDIWADARDQADSDEVRSSAVLCFGDSQIQQGVLASVVSERLGVPAYNLALPAGQPAAAEALLRRALDAGATPKAVVVGFFPAKLARDLRFNARTWPEVLGPSEALDLAFAGRDRWLAASTLLRLALPSCKARDEIRGNIRAAVRGEVDFARGEVADRRRTRRLARGSLALPSNPLFTDDPGPGEPRSDAGLSWRPSPANDRYLRRFLGLASRRGISVYWLSSPMSPSERAARERSGLQAGVDGFLRRLQGEFSNLVVLDTRSLGLDRTVFGDPYHLDGRGAAVLSLAVADAIAAGPSSRWVTLAREAPHVAAGTPGGAATNSR